MSNRRQQEEPATPADADARRLGAHHRWLAALVAIFILALLGGWALSSYRQTREQLDADMQWRLRAVELRISRLIEDAAAALTLSNEDLDTLDATMFRRLLSTRQRATGIAFVFDVADGDAMHSSTGLAPDTTAAAALARISALARANPDQLTIGDLYVRNGIWRLPVALAVDRRRASIASIDVEDLLSAWTDLGMQKGFAGGVLTREGRLLMRYPFVEKEIGLDISRGAVFTAIQATAAARGSVSVQQALTDGASRQIFWSSLAAVPGYHVTIGYESGQIRRDWVERFGPPLLLTLLACALFGAGLLVLDARARRAERATAGFARSLAALEQRWQAALRVAGLGVWEWSLIDDRADFSAPWKTMLGYDSADIAPHIDAWLDRVHPEDVAALREALTRHVSGGSDDFIAEHRLRCADGSYKWVLARGHAEARDARGRATRVVGTLTDLTDREVARRALEEKLAAEQADRAKSAFLSRMSHELRTPLNAILGFSQLLLADTRSQLTADQCQRVRHIERGGRHLLAMINDVLDLTLIEADAISVAIEPVDVGRVAADATALMAPLATESGVRIVSRMQAGDGWTAQADPTRLRQILVNLLSNAIKYNRRGGEVVLSADTSDGHVRIQVCDTGLGMTSEQAARAFDPFDRLGRESSGIEGTGIGLSLCKRLVELMHGTIRIDTVADRGTTVTVQLPAAQEAGGEQTRIPQLQESIAMDLPRRSMLYVEDNPASADLLRQVIGLRPDFELTVATDLAAALREARRLRPEIVVLDMNLPDGNGLEFVEAMRSDPRSAACVYIALSADATQETRDAAMAAGVREYLTKPLDVERFLAVIDRQLRRAG